MKVSEKKRLALIEAAQKEFIEFGFSSANMDRVCERAGTSKRTLYRHFGSKDVLYLESIKAVLQKQKARLRLEYSTDVDLETQLRDYLNAKLNSIYEDFGLPLARVVISEFIRTPELAETYLQHLHSQDELLNAWFEKAIADGKIKSFEPSLMSRMLMHLLKGHFFWPQLVTGQSVPNLQQREKIIANILTLFLDGYRA